jgi:2-dehydropantoate 2-reductase
MGWEKPRILVIGAGVNGSAVATHLYRAGVDVTVLARGKRFEELCSEGIVIENPFNMKRMITRVPVTDHLAHDDVFDYILVIVRKNQTYELLPGLAQNRSPNIVFMGNNLSGPADFVKALGQDRVMMGSVCAAGKRDGSLIRAVVFKSAAIPFGEIDGQITSRLERLIKVFHQSGLNATPTREIVDAQMTHGVGVAIIARLVIKHAGKIKNLARAKEDLKLYVAARREGVKLIRTVGHQVIPKTEALLANLPEFIQVLGMRLLLNSKFGMVGLEYHISQAPDEMQQMIEELGELVNQSHLPLPAIRKVLA